MVLSWASILFFLSVFLGPLCYNLPLFVALRLVPRHFAIDETWLDKLTLSLPTQLYPRPSDLGVVGRNQSKRYITRELTLTETLLARAHGCTHSYARKSRVPISLSILDKTFPDESLIGTVTGV